MDEDDPGMGIAQGSGCHPHFFAVGLFFPYDYHPVDGPECSGICGDSPHSGATAGIISSVLPFDNNHRVDEGFSEKTINEITKACVEMGKVKTGALIVIEQKVSLRDYERTGIDVDGIVTSQLLINIFEHNTPLHDGAVIVQGNRVASATCYLPLSDNLGLSKELGTRHRAGVGISEVTDSLTVIVSEETGKISVAYEGKLERNLDAETLRDRMHKILNNTGEEHKNLRIWKGRSREKK